MKCSALIIGTDGKGGDDEHDRSLLFSCACGEDYYPGSPSSNSALKGLGLAVRGALESICGETTQVLRLTYGDHGEPIVVAFAHLQACMVALALPGQLTDRIASGIVLQLCQSMTFLAGPSPSWTEMVPCTGDKKGNMYAVMKESLKVLFQRLCEGILRQLSGPGWNKVLPSCALETGVLCLQLEPDRQRRMESMLRAYEVSGMPDPSQQPKFDQPSMPHYAFYSRNCSLMYRGLTVWSGLPPAHTRLTWQLCWALGAHGQNQALPCQVTMHWVHPLVPGTDASAVDSTSDEVMHSPPSAEMAAAAAVAASTATPAVTASASSEAVVSHPKRSLLILVSACHMVLAVMLTAYDEDIEQLAGQVEAHNAVELLSTINDTFSAHMDRASSSSSLLRAVARPPLDPSTCKTPGRWDPSSDSPPERNHRSPRRSASQGRARGHHHHPGAGGMGSSLFMRIVSRTMTPRGMSTAAGLPGRSRLASGTSDHEASSGYSVPGSPAGRAVSLNAPRVSYSSCSVPNSPGQSRNIPQPVSSPHISGSKLGTTARAGGYVPAEATISESTPPDSSFVSRLGLSVHLPPESPGPSFSPEEKAGRLDRGLGPYSPQREYSDRDMTLLSPSASCAVIVFDAESGRITISGDIPHIDMAEEIWAAVSSCRTAFDNGSLAISAPPRHSRLCMTIQQIEQLSATMSQREGGQRLGSADTAPWQYHPEVAGLSTALQVTRCLKSPQRLMGMQAPKWFITACKRAMSLEVFIVHSEEVDEAAVLEDIFSPRQQQMGLQRDSPMKPISPQQKAALDALITAKPPAARTLAMGTSSA